MYQAQKVGAYDFSFGSAVKFMELWMNTLETYNIFWKMYLVKCTENQNVFLKNLSKVVEESCRK